MQPLNFSVDLMKWIFDWCFLKVATHVPYLHPYCPPPAPLSPYAVPTLLGQMCRLMFLSNGTEPLNKILLPLHQPALIESLVSFIKLCVIVAFFLFLCFFFLFISPSLSLLRNRLADGSLVTLFNGAKGVILKGRLVIGSIIQTRDFHFPLFFQREVGFLEAGWSLAGEQHSGLVEV